MDDGKRVTVCAKVSESAAAVIGARCAVLGVTRSAWLGSLIAASLDGVTEAGVTLGMRLTIDPEMPPGTAALVAPHPEGRLEAQVISGIGDDPVTVVPAETPGALAASLDEPAQAPPALARAAGRLREARKAAHPCCRHCKHPGARDGHDAACTKC